MKVPGVFEVAPHNERHYRAALAEMEAVMARPTFTFADIWTAGDRALPSEEKAGGATCYRWADRLLQRARKAGEIELLPGRKGWRPARSAQPVTEGNG